MKIQCDSSELNHALNTVIHAVPARTTTTILEGILMQVSESEIAITGTDTNMTIECRIPAVSDGNGSFVVPAKLFSSIVSKLPNPDVRLDYNTENKQMNIRSGKSHSRVVCMAADDFPKIAVKKVQHKITLRKDIVKNMIRMTAFSASTEEINGALTGVLCEITPGMIRMVAVDTFRIAMRNELAEGADLTVNVIIPATQLTEVSRIIPDEGDDTLIWEIAGDKAVLYFDSTKVIVNTLNGRFIDYRRFINADMPISIRVKREELAHSIDMAALLASAKNSNMIIWDVREDSIQISSPLSEVGDINDVVEIIREGGENFKIGFNSKYLMDALRCIDDEEIRLYMKDNISPCIIRPLDGDRYLYFLLPVRI